MWIYILQEYSEAESTKEPQCKRITYQLHKNMKTNKLYGFNAMYLDKKEPKQYYHPTFLP